MSRLLPLLVLAAACASAPAEVGADPRVRIAHLEQGSADGLAALRRELVRANPGYDVAWRAPLDALEAAPATRIAFVQAGAGHAVVTRSWCLFADEPAEVGIGDVIVLEAGDVLSIDGDLDALVFTVPGEPPAGVPAVVRPDHDPAITDTPGGCATAGDAYRRLCLTWQPERGAYVFHGLNAHRVRIEDSFTHYHPTAGGFDELYLVQDRLPGGALLASERLDRILAEDLSAGEVRDLFERRELEPGDLVWLPRGVVHRGLDGVLAHVIAIPGFRPGAEIGVDEHLVRINGRLGLSGAAALPHHVAAADAGSGSSGVGR